MICLPTFIYNIVILGDQLSEVTKTSKSTGDTQTTRSSSDFQFQVLTSSIADSIVYQFTIPNNEFIQMTKFNIVIQDPKTEKENAYVKIINQQTILIDISVVWPSQFENNVTFCDNSINQFSVNNGSTNQRIQQPWKIVNGKQEYIYPCGGKVYGKLLETGQEYSYLLVLTGNATTITGSSTLPASLEPEIKQLTTADLLPPAYLLGA